MTGGDARKMETDESPQIYGQILFNKMCVCGCGCARSIRKTRLAGSRDGTISSQNDQNRAKEVKGPGTETNERCDGKVKRLDRLPPCKNTDAQPRRKRRMGGEEIGDDGDDDTERSEVGGTSWHFQCVHMRESTITGRTVLGGAATLLVISQSTASRRTGISGTVTPRSCL